MAARAAFGVLFIAFSLLAAANGQDSSNHTITVSGYGNIQSLSDTAAVSVQVSSTQNLASDARANVSSTVTAIISALAKAYGSSEALSVTTASLNVNPQSFYNRHAHSIASELQGFMQRKPSCMACLTALTPVRAGLRSTDGSYKRTGYQYQHNLQINIQNVTSQLLAGIIDAVVNQSAEISINSISFGLSPSVKNGLWLDARNAAVGDAKGTAQLYAKARPPAALGVQLGPIVALQEVQGSASSSSYAQGTGAPLTATDATNGSSKASAVSIGQQTVTVQVTAVYQLLLQNGGTAASASAPAPVAWQPGATAGRR